MQEGKLPTAVSRRCPSPQSPPGHRWEGERHFRVGGRVFPAVDPDVRSKITTGKTLFKINCWVRLSYLAVLTLCLCSSAALFLLASLPAANSLAALLPSSRSDSADCRSRSHRSDSSK